MIRYNFLKKETVKNDIQFYDIGSIDWSEFEFTKGYEVYILNQNDVHKFYNLMIAKYERIDIEDLIYLINGIANPLELKPGMKIKLPHIDDINVFLQNLQDNI